MARLVVCSVFDAAVGAYASPFVARALGEASRGFASACADAQLPFKRSPGDYRLYHLGFFDDNAGRFECLEHPIPLMTVAEALELLGSGDG